MSYPFLSSFLSFFFRILDLFLVDLHNDDDLDLVEIIYNFLFRFENAREPDSSSLLR